MDARRVTVWCKVLGKLVEVQIAHDAAGVRAVPGVPPGWSVCACLDKDVECFGTGCPFTTDGGECPFGEVGERPERGPEPFDPFAGPSFEGEWD